MSRSNVSLMKLDMKPLIIRARKQLCLNFSESPTVLRKFKLDLRANMWINPAEVQISSHQFLTIK